MNPPAERASATPSESRTDIELSASKTPEASVQEPPAPSSVALSPLPEPLSPSASNTTPGTVRTVPQDCRDREPARRNRHASAPASPAQRS